MTNMADASASPTIDDALPAVAWPRMSLAEVERTLCVPGSPYEIETVTIDGVPTRTWKNQPRNLAGVARMVRAGFGGSTFLVYEDERVTYEGWYRATAALAAELARLGIGKGDRVALAMRNLPEWPVAFFAVVSLGAVVVPLNAWWTGPELAYGLGHSGSKLLICDAARGGRVRPHLGELPDLEHAIVTRAGGPLDERATALEAIIGAPAGYGALPDIDLPAVEILPEDGATIFYTSGTTGKPKGALGTHRNILTCLISSSYANTRSALRRGEAATPPEPKVGLIVVPMFHVTACNAFLMATMATGSTMIFMPKWDAVQAFELIEREQVTTTGGVPAIAWQLIEHPDRHKYDLSSLETIAYGGAPSAPELVRKIESDLHALPSNGWGMTETSATVTTHSAEDYLHRPDSCGPALPVSDLKIMSEDGSREMPVGEIGELWARGPQIVKGYWNDPVATAAAFVDGWVKTGDIARLDDEGFCFIVDRAKDVIIRGGENIYSSEVENALYDHPAVTDAALVGVPHRTLGEVPAAVVHLAPGQAVSEAELQEWVRARLAAFKVPVRVLFSDTILPRNANGKVLKAELRGLFGESQR
jgi:acyl-CoA synthetase (AMP-forming)/AMP-acid ligase II